MRWCTFAVLSAVVAAPAAAQDVTGLAAMHDMRREGGKLCMSDHFHWGNGSGPTKATAEKAAIRSWIDFTDLEYGRRWASYGHAASRKTKYTKEASGWSASVEARPCRR